MRAAFSLGLLALAALALPQAFGRFGYRETTSYSGLNLGRDGFSAVRPGSDRIRFGTASTEWTPIQTSEFEQMVSLGEAEGSPSRLRISLLTAGVSYYFPKGLRLKVNSTSAPYLTWTDGSGSVDVPTPKVRWVALSFRDAQPAILFGFPDAPASLRISGRPGDYEVQSDDVVGWVRVGLPRGQSAEPTNTAAALGRLAQVATRVAPVLAGPVPNFVKFAAEAETDGNAVIASWTFDRGRVYIPLALTHAPLGGYPVSIQTRVQRATADLGLGPEPRDISLGNTLQVRFPVRRVPIGRAVVVGETLPAIGTVSPLDVPSVAELALETLMGNRDRLTRKSAESAFAQFVEGATYQKEPFTQQQLTYDEAGVGIDLTAAHALLEQALVSTTQASSEANALLTSLSWRRDWATWLPWVENQDLRRRAAALGALAGAICPEPNRRVAAGMFQAGLASERGLNIWRRRRGFIPAEPQLLEPMTEVRTGLFRLTGTSAKPHPFPDSLLSAFRVFSEEPVSITDVDGVKTLRWPVIEPKAGILALATVTPLQAEAVSNLPRFKVERILGITEISYTPEAAGICEVRLTLPAWAPLLPLQASPPRYSEPRL